MGLAIAKGIVDSHEDRIWIESGSGRHGTRAWSTDVRRRFRSFLKGTGMSGLRNAVYFLIVIGARTVNLCYFQRCQNVRFH